jgi:hypothetical protein
MGWRRLLSQAIGVDQWILDLQQLLKRLLFLRRSAVKALIDEAREQYIEFLHAAAAAPTDSCDVRPHQ